MKKEIKIKQEPEEKIEVETDPRAITELYRCPFCSGLALTYDDVVHHGVNFHRIKYENWKPTWRIETIDVKSLFNNNY